MEGATECHTTTASTFMCQLPNIQQELSIYYNSVNLYCCKYRGKYYKFGHTSDQIHCRHISTQHTTWACPLPPSCPSPLPVDATVEEVPAGFFPRLGAGKEDVELLLEVVEVGRDEPWTGRLQAGTGSPPPGRVGAVLGRLASGCCFGFAGGVLFAVHNTKAINFFTLREWVRNKH